MTTATTRRNGSKQAGSDAAARTRASARVSRAISVGAVACSLLAFANPVSSRVCGIFSGNGSRQMAHQEPIGESNQETAQVQPPADASGSSSTSPQSDADLTASLGERDSDTAPNSTAPQWIND